MIDRPLHLMVGMVFRNAADTLPSALDSVHGQAACGARVSVLLVDDGSTDGWREALAERLNRRDLHIRQVDFRSAAMARNFVLHEVEQAFPDVDYICRLDADDVLAGPDVLRHVVAVLERGRPDVLVAGNWQALNGKRLPLPNSATLELLDAARLVARLQRMAEGDSGAELPSCNTIVRRGLPARYPLVHSAEDHWYLTTLLLGQRTWRVDVAADLLYAEYRLRGGLTKQNAKTDAYFRSRRDLLQFARRQLDEGLFGKG